MLPVVLEARLQPPDGFVLALIPALQSKEVRDRINGAVLVNTVSCTAYFS